MNPLTDDLVRAIAWLTFPNAHSIVITHLGDEHAWITYDAVTFGLSNADAHESAPNVVTFTYRAPGVLGVVVGTLTIADDGSIFDDTSDDVYPSFEEFAADLAWMTEDWS